MDFTTCAPVNSDTKPNALDALEKAIDEIKMIPPRKKLPVYLDGKFKGFIRLVPAHGFNSNCNSFYLNCPKGFLEWKERATFGDLVDDLD